VSSLILSSDGWDESSASELEVRRLGSPVSRLRTIADPTDTATLHRLLVSAIKRDGRQPTDIEDYELVVRDVKAPDVDVLAVYVSAAVP